MISINILREVEQLLYSEIGKCIPSFKVSKKEKGHTLAAIIEEKVSDILISHGYQIDFEKDSKGEKRVRSNSDFLFDGHKVNVKFGMSKHQKFGQPNVTALKKIIKDFDRTDCDAYYLIKIKYTDGDINIVFVDILNHPQVLTYNGGPGQIMLNEKQFYDIEDLYGVHLTKNEKFKFLVNMYITKTREHIKLRLSQLNKMELLYEQISSQR